MKLGKLFGGVYIEPDQQTRRETQPEGPIDQVQNWRRK